jgi:hypothetical protein
MQNLQPHPEALASRFWTELGLRIQENSDQSGLKPRLTAINVPLAGGASGPAVGVLNSIGVTFNCRIVGYQMWALIAGSVVLDIQRSTPMGHAVAVGNVDGTPIGFPSLIGTAVEPPAINGLYAENLDTSLWAARDLAAGDMLHIWVVSSDSLLRYGTIMLYMQDLDALVQSAARTYTGA